MNVLIRRELRAKVNKLARTKFKSHPAPRKAISEEMKKELTDAGVPFEDHFIFVTNALHLED